MVRWSSDYRSAFTSRIAKVIVEAIERRAAQEGGEGVKKARRWTALAARYLRPAGTGEA